MAADVKVDQKLQQMITALRLQSPLALERALDGKLLPIVANAKRAWPKKTGASAAALRVRVELENGRIVRYVQDLMPYAGAVHPKGTEALSRDTLVFDPIEAALQPMLEAFARELGKV